MDVTGAGLHNIETKWLYDFLTLEKCRNFSQAAIIRNVSQPAFSRRIRALEHAVGVELFNRQVSPLQLSEQGKIFHSQVRHLLQQLEINLTELRGGSDYTLRKIKIAAAHSLSLGLLPTIVKQMPTQFTYAVEAIDVDQAVDMLREGQSDFIFSYHDENLQQAPFDNIRLFESRLFPVCANNGRGEPRYTLEQPHFPLLNYSQNSYMGRLINRTLTRHAELSFSTFFVSSMSELLKQVAMDGCGIAWLPEYAIRQEITDGRLIVLDADELVIPIQAYAYRMNTRMSQVAETFWRDLRGLSGRAVNTSGGKALFPGQRGAGVWPGLIPTNRRAHQRRCGINHRARYRAFMSGHNKRNFGTPHNNCLSATGNKAIDLRQQQRLRRSFIATFKRINSLHYQRLPRFFWLN